MSTITRSQLLIEAYRAAAFLRRLSSKNFTPTDGDDPNDPETLKLWAKCIDVLAKTYRPVGQPVVTSTGWDRNKP